jgi:hypothetical protein
VALVADLSQAQAQLLIRGEVLVDDGTGTGNKVRRPSPDINKLSGIAYLSGGDTWIDLPHRLGLPTLQPTKVHLGEVDDPLRRDVLILLSGMREEFGGFHLAFSALLRDATADAREQHGGDPCLEVLEEIVDAVGLLALRAKQVHMLYSSKTGEEVGNGVTTGSEADDHATRGEQDSTMNTSAGVAGDEATPTPAELQAQSRKVIEEATEIVRRREDDYKVHWKRIGAWRENPTVYRYGYLWAVHSLYYWWRDQGVAEAPSQQALHSPCYLNRMDPTEIGYGWGRKTVQFLRDMYNKYSPFRMGYPLELINCMSPPSEEYVFPKNILG